MKEKIRNIKEIILEIREDKEAMEELHNWLKKTRAEDDLK